VINKEFPFSISMTIHK